MVSYLDFRYEVVNMRRKNNGHRRNRYFNLKTGFFFLEFHRIIAFTNIASFQKFFTITLSTLRSRKTYGVP